MRLVVDANVIFSALIRSSKTSELLFSDKLELFAPEFLFTELDKYRKYILQKSGITEAEFELALSIIFTRIKIVSYEEIEMFMLKAKNICPDPNDILYFAVAFAFSIPIWSNDKKLKEQKEIEVLSTEDMLRLFRTRSQ